MTNIFKSFNIALSQKEVELLCRVGIILAVLLYAISFFDKALSIGFFLLLLLSFATIFILYGFGVRDKNIYAVFLAGLSVHLGAVLFLYWTGFKPFGGGADFTLYDQIAREIAQRFSHGNFSLAGLYTDHFFPILIGILYMLTFPSMIVGQFFTVWLAALSISLVYLIVLEIGGAKKIAFLASLIISLYPSYLYFGSVLLKDTVIIPLALLGIFLILKIVKHFSWGKFFLFFVILTCLINLRFYIGYALMASFIFSWLLLSGFSFKKKIIYWLAIVFLLGFSPQLLGDGYYGFKSFKKFLNPAQITYYREVAYSNLSVNSTPAPTASKSAIVSEPSVLKPAVPAQKPLSQGLDGGGSNFSLKTGFDGGIFTFSKNSLQSFIYSLLGPFPWQFRYQRQITALAETIPWYILIMVFLYGSARFIKKKGILGFLKLYKLSFPLLLFGIFSLGALSLFINNYGVIARIRIPVFICLISIMFISFNDFENKKLYEKISHNWRGWIYRFPFIRSPFKPGQ